MTANTDILKSLCIRLITIDYRLPTLCTAATISRVSAAFVPFQRQPPSIPPTQNINSAASPVHPARQFSENYANNAANVTTTATFVSFWALVIGTSHNWSCIFVGAEFIPTAQLMTFTSKNRNHLRLYSSDLCSKSVVSDEMNLHVNNLRECRDTTRRVRNLRYITYFARERLTPNLCWFLRRVYQPLFWCGFWWVWPHPHRTWLHCLCG